jgi:hypothetical protein
VGLKKSSRDAEDGEDMTRGTLVEEKLLELSIEN